MNHEVKIQSGRAMWRTDASTQWMAVPTPPGTTEVRKRVVNNVTIFEARAGAGPWVKFGQAMR